jgi:hypothetical protein
MAMSSEASAVSRCIYSVALRNRVGNLIFKHCTCFPLIFTDLTMRIWVHDFSVSRHYIGHFFILLDSDLHNNR